MVLLYSKNEYVEGNSSSYSPQFIIIYSVIGASVALFLIW